MLKSLFTCLLILLNFAIFSQNREITIQLQYEDKNDSTTSRLSAYADSTYVNQFHTQIVQGGKIRFSIPDSLNCFFLSVSNLNYYTSQKTICSPFKTETVQLYKKTIQLEEIVISGFKNTEISVSGNTAEIRPGKVLKSAKGQSAKDVVKNLPEVFVLPDNEIKIRGQNINEIYLHLSPDSPGTTISKEMMNKVNISFVSKIVVLYNERELHVFLDKKNNTGYLLDADLESTQGREFYSSLNPNFSFHKGKTTVWLQPKIGYIKENPTTFGYYKTMIGQDNQLLNSKSNTQDKLDYIGAYLMVEHNIDSVYTSGLQFDYNHNNRKTLNTVSNFSNDGLNTSEGTTEDLFKYDYFSPSLYFQAKYPSNWTFLLKSGLSKAKSDNSNSGMFSYQLDQEQFSGLQELNQQNDTEVIVNELTVKRTFKSGNSFIFKVYNEKINTSSNTNIVQNLLNVSALDSTFNNKLIENKSIISPELKMSVFKKGLLSISSPMVFYIYENTSGSLEKFEYITERWLPSFSLSYPIKKAKYLTFFGNTTFRTQNLKNLLFNTISYDGLVTNENNPGLVPSTTYQIGASYSPLNKLQTSIYYLNSSDTYMNYPLFDENALFLGNRKINLSEKELYGLGLSFSNTFFENLFTSNNLNIAYNSWANTGDFNFSTKFASWIMNNSFYYTTTNDWSFRLNLISSSNQRLSEKIKLNSYSRLDIGISKKLNDYFSIYCNANNILNSYRPKLESLDSSIDYFTEINFDKRNAVVGINFNLQKKFEKKDKKENIMRKLKNKIEIKNSNDN